MPGPGTADASPRLPPLLALNRNATTLHLAPKTQGFPRKSEKKSLTLPDFARKPEEEIALSNFSSVKALCF